MNELCKTCPNGCSDGMLFRKGTKEFVRCSVCYGTGVVLPNRICACGGPAFYMQDSFAYCGNPKCLEDLKKDAISSEEQQSSFYDDDMDEGYLWNRFGGRDW